MTAIPSPVVPAYGPTDAKLAWIGETPGPEEVRQGRPFIGAAGYEARKTLRQCGISPDDVYWDNCCRIKVLPFPSGKRGANILHEWSATLNDSLAKLTQCRVIVACGGVALWRLTGYRDITDYNGSVLRDLPSKVTLYATKSQVVETDVVLPKGVVVVPCLHPAGIMRDPSRAQMPLLHRAIEKAAKVVRGELQGREMREVFYPDLAQLREL